MIKKQGSNSQSEQGYVALLAVLIVGAAATAVALALLISGTDSQRFVLVSQQSAQARNLATACAEEALQMIHDDVSFIGSSDIITEVGTCNFTISGIGNNRNIIVTGNVEGVVRKINIYATLGPSSISITSWQEAS